MVDSSLHDKKVVSDNAMWTARQWPHTDCSVSGDGLHRLPPLWARSAASLRQKNRRPRGSQYDAVAAAMLVLSQLRLLDEFGMRQGLPCLPGHLLSLNELSGTAAGVLLWGPSTGTLVPGLEAMIRRTPWGARIRP